MIAEILPDPHSFQAIGWGLVMIASLALSGNQIMKLVDRVKGVNHQSHEIKPQPFSIALTEKIATKEELKAFEELNRHEHENMWSKIGGVERGNRTEMVAMGKDLTVEISRMEKKADERCDKIQERMNELAEDLPWKILERLRKEREIQ